MNSDHIDAPRPLYRVQENVLALGERRLLNWLCARLPHWVTPDILTAIGVFGAAIVFAGYALSGWHPATLWLAILGYAVQWFAMAVALCALYLYLGIRQARELPDDASPRSA